MARAALTLIQTITRKMTPNKILRNSFIPAPTRVLYPKGYTCSPPPQIREPKGIFAEFNSSRILSKTSGKSGPFVYIHAWPNSQDGIPGSRQEDLRKGRWLLLGSACSPGRAIRRPGDRGLVCPIRAHPRWGFYKARVIACFPRPRETGNGSILRHTQLGGLYPMKSSFMKAAAAGAVLAMGIGSALAAPDQSASNPYSPAYGHP